MVPLTLTERGALRRIYGISAVSNLDLSIAERQRTQSLRRLAEGFADLEIAVVQIPSRFRGTMLLLIAEFEHSHCCYFGLGAALNQPSELQMKLWISFLIS